MYNSNNPPPNAYNQYGSANLFNPKNNNHQYNYQPTNNTQYGHMQLEDDKVSGDSGGKVTISTKKTIKRRKQVKNVACGVGCITLCLFSIVGAALYLTLTQEDDSFLLFPDETRNEDDYIGLLFENVISDELEVAFDIASDRWSKIIAGSEGSLSRTVLPGSENLCGQGTNLGSDEVLDHLRIIVSTSEIDGEGGVLGQATPCIIEGSFVLTGFMFFDEADVVSLSNNNQLNAVILHEMAHVLGIGSLWRDEGLIIDLVANADNTRQPKYIGASGVAQFQLLAEDDQIDFVPVENGFTKNAFNGAGSGSVNVHFDEDDLLFELMTFRVAVVDQPLSTITIGCLEDLGYVVDFTQADTFIPSIETLEGSNELKADFPPEDYATFVDDIYPYEPIDVSDLLS